MPHGCQVHQVIPVLKPRPNSGRDRSLVQRWVSRTRRRRASAEKIAFDILDEKLQNLDAMYSNRREDFTSMHNLSTEEKLLLFQRNIELRTKENLREQVTIDEENHSFQRSSFQRPSRWNNSERMK